ncbi:serine/threonine protein kinase [Candidatus Uabimicrobium amorphum]|uniref:non-specific serine/threonine protein kinase n=1 Tax=Uabimicrobium amorphum TaxID=2596890 RepID=A0A5S9IQK7_UABAM|nr:serine/threonine-protein kinase [Candidatus Uabimicrobium amorphum]BBM86094.1 protein kinase [Candidatus Uabimicrobium amorphum]
MDNSGKPQGIGKDDKTLSITQKALLKTEKTQHRNRGNGNETFGQSNAHLKAGKDDKTRILSETNDLLKETQKRPITAHRIGRYQIMRKLGEGNFGQVFLVRDLEWDRELALKVLSAGTMANDLTIKRFYREAQAISQLNHPNIVGIYEVGRDKNNHFYTMDYIGGWSLADVLDKEKRINSRKAARIMTKVAQAVHYAHEHNIIHRDIKPDNIMLNQISEPFLTDFGLAKAIRGGTRLSKTGQINGTPAYMAPEQISGKNSRIDEKADIYSLGATLYEMITGQVPFPGNNTMDVLYRVTNVQPTHPREINKNIPQDLENIALKCLQKKKKDRYSSALEMAQDLERYLEGAAIKASVKTSRTKWIRQNKQVSIASFFAITIVSMLVYIWHQSSLITKIEKEKRDALAKIEKITLAKKTADEERKKADEKREKAEKKALVIEQRDRDRAAMENKLLAKSRKELKEAQNKIKELKTKDGNTKQPFGQNWGQNWQENMRKWQNRRGGNDYSDIRMKVWSLPYHIQSGVLPEEMDSIKEIDFLFGNLMIIASRDSRPYVVWGKAYLLFFQKEQNEKHLQTAIDKFRQAVKLNPKAHEAILMGYQSALLLSDQTKSRATVKEFVKHFPKQGKNAYFFLFKALQYKMLGQEENNEKYYEESLKYLNKVIKKQPALKTAHIEKSFVLRKLGRYYIAQKSIVSNDVYGLLEMVLIYLQRAMISPQEAKQNIKKAKGWFDIALAKNAIVTKIYLNRSQAFQQWKQKYNEYATHFNIK